MQPNGYLGLRTYPFSGGDALTIEAAKEWLFRYGDAEKQLDFMEERIRNLRSQMCDPRSSQITGMPSGGGEKADKIGRLIGRVDALERQYNEQLEASRHLYGEIDKTISQIPGKRSPEMQAVLRMRHLDLADWETICEMMYGKREDFLDRYDTYKRRMFQIYRNGLEAVANFIPEGGDEDD